jgi:Holliday junction DNA helicase RuvA
VISFLEGEIAEKGSNRVVIAVGGVGYEVLTPTAVLSGLPASGTIARLQIRMVVREDAMVLYGFTDTGERDLFDMLTGVTGIGPKVALSFLSAMSADALRKAVIAGDVGALTVVPGVGKKVAQRVVLDLRDRLGGEGEPSGEGPLADVREALLSLGLTPLEAGETLASIEADGREADDLLREALQKAGR